MFFFFFSSRRRHTRLQGDWSSDVCSSDLATVVLATEQGERAEVLLREAGVRALPVEIDLDADLTPEPGLFRADVDLAAGCRSDDLGVQLYSDAELFGRVRRVAASPASWSSTSTTASRGSTACA